MIRYCEGVRPLAQEELHVSGEHEFELDNAVSDASAAQLRAVLINIADVHEVGTKYTSEQFRDEMQDAVKDEDNGVTDESAAAKRKRASALEKLEVCAQCK
jgi:hypothetical protein